MRIQSMRQFKSNITGLWARACDPNLKHFALVEGADYLEDDDINKDDFEDGRIPSDVLDDMLAYDRGEVTGAGAPDGEDLDDVSLAPEPAATPEPAKQSGKGRGKGRGRR
jgi:hypothetical protein